MLDYLHLHRLRLLQMTVIAMWKVDQWYECQDGQVLKLSIKLRLAHNLFTSRGSDVQLYVVNK